MTIAKRLIPLLPTLCLACGHHAIDLDHHAPKVSPSNEPGVLGVIDERVTSLAVDDERLYWIGSWAGPVRDFSALRSCKKENCASTLVTYNPNQVDFAGSFALRGHEIYWSESTDGDTSTLLSCDVSGCESGVTTLTRALPGEALSMLLDESAVYVFARRASDYSGARVYRTPLSGADRAPVALLEPPGNVSLALSGGYVYALNLNNGEDERIQRIRADGSTAPELIASDLSALGQAAHRLAVSDARVYWSQSALRGAILSCPVTGCADPKAPEVFASPTRTPESVWLDGESLYWAHDTAALGYALAACRVAQCDPSDVVAPGGGASNAIAFDATSIYTATDAVAHVIDSYSNPSVSIRLRRFPKGSK